jgi:hypothetical protein
MVLFGSLTIPDTLNEDWMHWSIETENKCAGKLTTKSEACSAVQAVHIVLASNVPPGALIISNFAFCICVFRLILTANRDCLLGQFQQIDLRNGTDRQTVQTEL